MEKFNMLDSFDEGIGKTVLATNMDRDVSLFYIVYTDKSFIAFELNDFEIEYTHPTYFNQKLYYSDSLRETFFKLGVISKEYYDSINKEKEEKKKNREKINEEKEYKEYLKLKEKFKDREQ